MKKLSISLFACLLVCLFITSCKPDPMLPNKSDVPIAQLSEPGLPVYTIDNYFAMIEDTDNEEAFVAKSKLVTYIATRLIATYSGIEEGTDLSTAFPCDWAIDEGNLRTMSDLGDPIVAILDGYVADCITAYEESEDGLFAALLASMEHKGVSYSLKSHYDADGFNGTENQKVFLSYEVIWNGEEYQASGFVWNIKSNVITWDEMNYGEAADMVTVIFVPITGDPDPEYINDPCHYTGGSSGSGFPGTGGGGTGSGYDDDGNEKRAWNGSIVTAPLYPQLCSGASGLRIAELHLAERGEAGVANKSEVYVSTTFYSIDPSGNVWDPSLSFNPCPTCSPNKTNNSGYSTQLNTSAGVTYYLGKNIANIPPSSISPSSNTIITEASTCCAATNGDWTLLVKGFCNDYENAYNRVLITIWERDHINNPQIMWNSDLVPHTGFDIKHYDQSRYISDVFLKWTIAPNDFLATGSIYIYGGPGHSNFNWSTSQPAASYTWAKIELF